MVIDTDFQRAREAIGSVNEKLARFRDSYCGPQRAAAAGLSPFLDGLIKELWIAGCQLEAHDMRLRRHSGPGSPFTKTKQERANP